MKLIQLSRSSTLLVSFAVALALPLAACSDDQAAREAERAAQAEDARQAEAARAEEPRQAERGTMMDGEDHMMDGEDHVMDANRQGTMESMQHRAGEMMDQAGDAASDMRMHMALEMQLASSDQLSAMMINTDVKDGVAHLEGEVRTDAQREMAGELAMTVDGVKSVMNDLKVTGDTETIGEQLAQGASDAAVTARVKSRLLASENTSGLGIDVDTAEGVVTLSGEVGSDTERELAELIASNTPGVASVKNELSAGND